MGKGSNAKHFKNRVSTLIRDMFQNGELEKTHKGVGSDPHRYKRAVQLSTVKNGNGGFTND